MQSGYKDGNYEKQLICTGLSNLTAMLEQPGCSTLPSTLHPLFAAALDHPEGGENGILFTKAQIKVIFCLPMRTF